MENVLENLGLSANETAVLYSLLELGQSNVSQIAKSAGVNRTTAYDVLESLSQKGFVSNVGDKSKKTYIAEPPEALVAHLEKKSFEISQKLEAMRQSLPELKAIYSEKGIQPHIRFFEGKEGIEAVYEDTLTSTEPIRAYASVRDMHQALPHYFPKYYQRRTEKGIAIRAIVPDTPEGKERKSFDAQEARVSVLVPIKKFDFSPEINIYDDKVAVMSLAEEFGVIIQSKEIAEAQKKIFELAWLGAKSVETS